jgi:hypothetical protein
LLPKLYYCHSGSVKKSRQKTNKKNLVKIVEFKLTCSKWDFDQVGHGGKKTIWGVFLAKILGQKNHDLL